MERQMVDYKMIKKLMMFSRIKYLGIEVSPGTSEFFKHWQFNQDPKLLDLKYQGIGFGI